MPTYYAQVSYTGDGTTTDYAITFSFIDSSHVKAFIDGVETTAFTIASSTLTFTSAPANASVVRIERQTPIANRLVDFTDGSVLTESDLDRSADQNFFVAQEITDDSQNTMRIGTDDKWDAQSKVIKDVADPVNNNDAVNKSFISTNLPNITTVAGISSDVTTVAGISANVTSVAGNATNVNTVATNISSVNTVATNINDVISVANDLAEAVSEVETVANDLNETTSEIDTVANSITNVDAVGTNISNVNTVAGISSNITTVAGVSSNVSTLAPIASDITSVAGISANVTTVAGVASNVTTVAGISSDVSTVAGANSNISTVAGAVTNINNVGGSIANVNTVASNLSGVNSFGERYRVGTSDPSSSLDEGDLFYNSSSNALKYYNGNAWASITAGISDVVDDTTPQLGGNLDTNEKEINTISNRNILLAPNGTGVVEIKGNTNEGTLQLNCENNSHGVKIKAPPHSAGQSYTLTLPQTSPQNDKVLGVNSSGELSFIDSGITRPTITTSSLTIAPSTSSTVTIAGTNFISVPIVEAISSTGAVTRASAVSFTSASSIDATFNLSGGSYHIRVENNDGGAVRTTNAILTVSSAPSFSTSAGSLGSVGAGESVSLSVSASSDSAVTITETTSVLTSNSDTPATTMNLSLSSAGAITGTAPTPTSDTTYTFTLQAQDAEGQTTTRQFSITISTGVNNSGGFN